MIVFDLQCRLGGHRFEGWFGSSADFDSQCARGLVECPECGSADVHKAVMAPNVGRKGNQLPSPVAAQPPVPSGKAQPISNSALPPEAQAMMRALAEMQASAIEKSRWVGESFADESRAMHYGEREAEPIYGKATIEEARDLLEEGIEVAPLPFPIVPPGEAN